MTKPKDFLAKYMSEQRELKTNRMPPQSCKVSMFNNEYKILTKSDAEICILQDTHGNRVAYRRDKFLSMIDEGFINRLDGVNKAALPGASKPITPKMGSSGKSGSRSFPIGTIHNGRKKIGEGVWVDVSSGHTHASHEGEQKRDISGEHGKAQITNFMKKIQGRVHPEDKPEIEKRLHKLVEVKNRVDRLKQIAGEHGKSGDQANLKAATDRAASLQDKYKESFKSLQTALKNSSKRLKEGK